jgi:hypothetical protein
MYVLPSEGEVKFTAYPESKYIHTYIYITKHLLMYLHSTGTRLLSAGSHSESFSPPPRCDLAKPPPNAFPVSLFFSVRVKFSVEQARVHQSSGKHVTWRVFRLLATM